MPRHPRTPDQVRRELRNLAGGEAFSAVLLPTLAVVLARPAGPLLVPLLLAAVALAGALGAAATFWRLRSRGRLARAQARAVAAVLGGCAVLAAVALVGALVAPPGGRRWRGSWRRG